MLLSLVIAAGLLQALASTSNGTQTTYGSFKVIHYSPEQSSINNITFAIGGTGRPGIYNSSATPNNMYGVYNWCNQPHVRAKEYVVAPSDYKLKYVEVIHRHHKRTPYASNTFPTEDIPWDCSGGPTYGSHNPSGLGKNTAVAQWSASWPNASVTNPFVRDAAVGFQNSNCQFPAITEEGLEDSIQHGKDIKGVYTDLLGFLPDKLDPRRVRVRVTNNVITSQVASGLVAYLFPGTETFIADEEPSVFDSLEPAYSCPAANTIKNGYVNTNSGAWADHLKAAVNVYAQLDAVSGIPSNDNGGFHASFDHYYDNLLAKQCHGKPLPCNLSDRSLCVTQALADTVYRLGNWEYSYQWRDAPNSALYSALHYGAFMLELREHLMGATRGDDVIYRHNVAHDGSISSILGFLQIANMVWPGMGSEIVFELYESRKSKKWFVRVLWGGQTMATSTPLGKLDFVPVEDFVAYVDSMVGSGSALYTACHS